MAILNSAHQAKQQFKFGSKQHQVYKSSSESGEPNRFSRCWKKVEKKCIQEQQPNQFHCYNQNIGFRWQITGLVSE